MKIAIYGHGYVGKAVAHALGNTTHSFNINDPKYFEKTEYDAECAIVCVDTPATSHAFCDLTQVKSVLDELKDKMDFPVLIKSSITPSLLKNLHDEYTNLRIVFSPEYLSSRNNIEDFMNQKFCIMGTEHPDSAHLFIDIFKDVFPTIDYRITDLVTASLVKYAENSFLATKVTFFNAMYDMHIVSDTERSFEEFVELLTLDERIGKSHTLVPGHDGKRGWGGHCFEKDIPAFIDYGMGKGVGGTLLDNVVKQNKFDRDFD